jgi:ABC-type uncharacterized transport system substrate-binding protein
MAVPMQLLTLRNIIIFILIFLTYGYAQDKPVLLIISVQGDIFTSAQNGIISELNDLFSFKNITISITTTPKDLRDVILSSSPKALALLDNKSINLYRKYCRTLDDSSEIIPSVALLSVNVQLAIQGMKNIQAISYESPMVTSLVKIRSILNIPLRSAGVICRKEFESFITKESIFCKNENIGIEKFVLNDQKESYPEEIRKYLEILTSKKNVQAIMVLNDNTILKPDLMMKCWIPFASKINIPFIVGVETLVRPEFNFGTFAVLPDSRAAGEQAAELFIDLMDQNWHFDTCIVYPAISVYTVLNYNKVKKVKNLNLGMVDKVIRSEQKK